MQQLGNNYRHKMDKSSFNKFCQLKMHSTIWACVSDDLLLIFKNLEKCDISKMCKTFIQSKISSVCCLAYVLLFLFFKSARPVCYRLHFKSIKITHTQDPSFFFFFKSQFLHFKPKAKDNCSETPLKFCPLKFTY